MREVSHPRYGLPNLLVDVLAISLLAFMGPFGFFDAVSLVDRVTFFGLITPVVGFCVFFFVNMFIRDPWLRSWPVGLRIAVGAAISSVPGTFVVYGLGHAILLVNTAPSGMLALWLKVLSVIAAITLVHFGLLFRGQYEAEPEQQPTQQEHEPAAPEGDPPVETGPMSLLPKTPAFVKRLPPEAAGDVISVSAQDHYVMVVTAEGAGLVLMRFSDALQELAEFDGLQVHRSHWVARAHLEGLSRVGGRPHVQLSDGRVLPVASARLKDVKAAIGA